MLQLLIIDNNFNSTKNILNGILNKTKDIKVNKIVTNKCEIIDILCKRNIDIIVLNEIVFNYKIILKIILSIQKKNIKNILVLNKKTQQKMIIEENGTAISFINTTNDIVEICKRIENENIEKNIDYLKDKVINELVSIGFCHTHQGTLYLAEAIIYMYKYDKKNQQKNIEKNVYKVIADKYNENIQKVKSNIIKATNYMYMESNVDMIKKYFHFYEDKKPTPKLVILTVLDKIKQM